MSNATITVSVPQNIKKQMEELGDANWSEIIRVFLVEKIQRMIALKKLDSMLKDSTLTEEDVNIIAKSIKSGIAKKHGL